MKTVNEIHEDKEFLKWFDKNGYHVNHYVGVTPIYMNSNNIGESYDEKYGCVLGQKCYLIEEIYEIYESATKIK